MIFWIMDGVISDFQVSQRDILNSIQREMSSDLREGFKAVGEQSLLASEASSVSRNVN